jgi:hypothetical protein
VADTVTQPDVARPRHIRVARSPRRQQTTEGLLEQRFALAVDRLPQCSWIDRRPQFLQPSALQLGQHDCGEQASERRLRRIPPPDGARLDVDVLEQAQNWLKQVVIDPHVRILRVERRSLGRSIQTHLAKIGTHQAGVFLLYEPMIILLIRARTREGQAGDSRPKSEPDD